jgi:hypothetical protein
VSNSKNNVSGLMNQLSRANSSNLHFSEFIQPLISSTTSRTASGSIAASSLGLRSLSVGSSEKLQGIQFGRPSSNTTPTSSSSGSAWKSLLSQTASGGLASVLSGGLSSITGLGGLISDITSLFGGSSKAAPPPLALFSLPDSIQQTAYVSSKGTSVYSGDVVEQNTKSSGSSAIYTSSGVVSQTAQSAAAAPLNSAAIAQAVKSALLTSNTLGDVIAEL